jgi:hypothetical protein
MKSGLTSAVTSRVPSASPIAAKLGQAIACAARMTWAFAPSSVRFPLFHGTGRRKTIFEFCACKGMISLSVMDWPRPAAEKYGLLHVLLLEKISVPID